jgi:hypothetical protein
MRSSPPKRSGVSTVWINALVSMENMVVEYERAEEPGSACTASVVANGNESRIWLVMSLAVPRLVRVRLELVDNEFDGGRDHGGMRSSGRP